MSQQTQGLSNKNIDTNVKQATFRMLFLIVKDTNLSILVYIGIQLISVFQTSYFKFSNYIGNVWLSDLSLKIKEAFGYVNFTHLIIENQDISSLQIIFYMFAALLIFQILIILINLILLLSQKEANNFFIKILRFVTLGLISVLYVPALHTFTLPLNCTNGYLTFYPQEKCWTGLIIIDQIIAIICLIVFVCLENFIRLLYFEGTQNSNSCLSMRNARCIFFYWCHQSIIIILTLLPESTNSQIVFEVYSLCGSLFCYLYAKQNDAYNYRLVQKIVLTIYSLELWSSLMLCISHLVEGRIMVGSLYTWIFCLPFILTLQFVSQLKREQCLMIYVNKFESSTQLVNHALEVLKLVDYDKRKLPEGQLVNGYIEFHNQTCPNQLCPLKKVKFTLNMFKAKNELLTKTDRRHQLIYDTIAKLYVLGIGKFKDDVFMRIEYALFILRILKSKTQALEELCLASEMYCSFDQKFVIYYITSVIEVEIQELAQDGQDFSEQKDFQEKFNLFKNGMEKSVALLMEFWSQFSDDKPDLAKLYEIGSKLFPVRLYVETAWRNLKRLQNSQSAQAFRLYSKYQVEIFNDRNGGFELLEQAKKIELSFSQRKAFKLGLTSNLNVDGQEDGCIFISLEDEKFAQIYAINMAAASIVGYDKNDLLHKKVNGIMPNLYARYHDDFLHRFQDTNEATLLNKERLLLAKNKNQYIQPVTVLLRPVYHVLKEGVEFVGTFKREKKIKETAYVVCNKDYLIEDLTSTCINLIGLDLKSLAIQDIHITDLITDFEQNYYDYRSKSGKSIDFIHPKVHDDRIEFSGSEIQIRLNIQIMEINFLIMKSNENINGLTGYQVRFEKVSDANISQVLNKVVKQNNFQFKPTISSHGMIGFYGEYTEATYSEMLTHLQENSLLASNLESDMRNSKHSADALKNQNLEDIIDLANGIKTMRLFEGQIFDIEKFQSDADMESYEIDLMKRDEQNIMDQDQAENESRFFKSTRELQETLNQQSECKAVRMLYYSSFIFIIFLIILAILNNVFERECINNENNKFQELIDSSNLIMTINEVDTYSRELVLVNFGLKQYEYADLLANLTEVIQKFDSLSKSIFQKVNYPVNVKMFTSSDSYDESILEQASQQLVSKALNIANLQSESLTENQKDYFYLNFNILNDFMRQLLQFYQLNVSNCQNIFQQFYNNTLIILILSACLTFLSSLLISTILTSTLDKRQEILSIFLDIPEKTAKQFYSKCENFLQQISSNEDDDVLSDVEMAEEKGGEENVSLLGRKKKKFKNNESKHLSFFLKMFIIGVVLESYFIMIYLLDKENKNKQENILNEFNYTVLSASYYAFVVNACRQLIFNDSISIFNQNTNDTVYELIENLYQMDTTYQRLHAVNVDYNSLAFVDYYNLIMFENLCDFLSEKDCSTFANGILAHGLMTSVSRHFQNIRKLYNTYQSVVINQSQPFPELNYELINLDSNELNNKVYNILNIPSSYETIEMQYIYLLKAFDLLKEKYFDVINTDQENFIVQELILMIIFLLALIIAYLFCWFPFIRRLNREIWSTKCLLTFIPIDEIQKIKSITTYFRTVILEQS